MGIFKKKNQTPPPAQQQQGELFKQSEGFEDLVSKYVNTAQKEEQLRRIQENQPQGIKERHPNVISDFDMVELSRRDNVQQAPQSVQQPQNSGYAQPAPMSPAPQSEIRRAKPTTLEIDIRELAMDMEPSGPVQKTERISRSEIDSVPKSSANRQNALVGVASIIGRRDSQQDAVAVSETNVSSFSKDWIGVLCDGMGGMNGGERASNLCIQMMMDLFKANNRPIPEFYRTAIVRADDAVASLTDENGNPLGGGSTLASVVISGRNLYWGSVGDSHIYVIRDDIVERVTREHNYMMELEEQVKRGEITIEEANADRNREALISFMGMGAVTLMDVNESPLELRSNDIILICSDGLYRSVSSAEMLNIIKICESNMQLAAEQLTEFAMQKNNPYQDNTSVILVKYR